MLPFRRDIIGFLSKVAAEFGDVAWFRVGAVEIVLLNQPDFIREVLQTNHQNFVKGRPLQLAKRLLGDGLLTSEGELHKRQSQKVQPAFRLEHLQSYGPAMTDCALRWSAGWGDGTRLDMMTEMTSLATAIAGRTMFGWEVDRAVAASVARALADAMSLFSRASIPFAEQLLKLPLPSSRRFWRAKQHLDSLIGARIAERRRENRTRADVLSMVLDASHEGDTDGRTDRAARDQALTLFLTALDTTSLALTWTWYLLSQHPAAEAQFHAEIDTVLGNRLPTVADLERLTYTRTLFLEAVRLYPPIYAIARQAVGDFTVGRHALPSGTLVLMSPYVTHRDPRYFRDPELFDPERWNGRAATRPPGFAYFPFGGGPRGCIGQSYAQQEAVLVLATLAREWRFRMVPGHPIGIRPLLNLRPSSGVPMLLERRR